MQPSKLYFTFDPLAGAESPNDYSAHQYPEWRATPGLLLELRFYSFLRADFAMGLQALEPWNRVVSQLVV
ncbi:hypothetical protein FG93_01819 [Bosea sp. LC85]|nr:hypothetical protein FG93_01819 [Bosea sp. LC85]